MRKMRLTLLILDGLGELTPNYTPSLSAMGSVSQGVYNPLVVIITIQHPTPLGMSTLYYANRLGAYNESNANSRCFTNNKLYNLSHFTIGFPVAMVGASRYSYSDVAYSFNDSWEDPASICFLKDLEVVDYMGHAFKLHKSLSIGAN